MNTVARPATGEPGIFEAATAGSTAASYWIGPSTSRSGRRSRTSAVASRTFSTSAPEPDSPVEYDSIAMRGSMPNCVGGLRGRDRDVGELLGGRVGVDRAVAVDEHAVGEAHEEHGRHDRDARPRLDDLERRADRVRGRVRGAGDHAVGEPEVHHHRAEVGDVLHQVARLVDGDALVGAQPRVLGGEAVHVASGSRGRDDRRASQMSRPSSPARARTSCSSPRIVRSHTSPRQQSGGGAQDAVVVPSGSTMCRVRRARAVDEVVLEHQRGDHVRARDVEHREQRGRVDVAARTWQARCPP